jgi:hypothetical protein
MRKIQEKPLLDQIEREDPIVHRRPKPKIPKKNDIKLNLLNNNLFGDLFPLEQKKEF